MTYRDIIEKLKNFVNKGAIFLAFALSIPMDITFEPFSPRLRLDAANL